jgi:hypothetical protein
MASPLSGSIATQIYKGMKALFLDATYTVDVAGTITDPADPPAPTPTNYACLAIVEKYSDYFSKQGLVQDGDRKVLILANSLSVRPVVNSRITISGITFTTIKVDTDPATAIWEIQGRM